MFDVMVLSDTDCGSANSEPMSSISKKAVSTVSLLDAGHSFEDVCVTNHSKSDPLQPETELPSMHAYTRPLC